MDKERKELEMAIARSMVDQQRLEAQKQTQNDLMENHMMKLSLKSAEGKLHWLFLNFDFTIFLFYTEKKKKKNIIYFCTCNKNFVKLL